MVTGSIDMKWFKLYPELGTIYGHRPLLPTQCSHIIPFSVNNPEVEGDETFGFMVRVIT